ncbi:MAG: alpha-glucosidase C-terminal domain-containing protein [Alphaproteobacteria bacterium]|nr:alpha-glucosidase C-terminal domain-containing protein [Alphaproteobacteria bacterium]
MGAWWRGASVYQIYPRSYCDSNGDGIGDLPGIISKLDYIASLGVDAIWLSPIHPSPNRDYGYDVADYFGIAPELGTMDDFARLLDEAHQRGLKVILDEVVSHTSDQHPWFIESRESRHSPKADWYEWQDPKADGSVPNNWLAAFGGPAWSYWPQRRQYYFHKFLREQPKLNLHNPAVEEAVLGVFDFWLKKGVDGFRLDVAHSFLHDKMLRDNPPIAVDERTHWHWSHASNLQDHVFDNGFPADGQVGVEHRRILDAIRAVCERFEDRFVFAEFAEAPRLLGHFVGDRYGVHSGYTFGFLYNRDLTPRFVAQEIALYNSFADLWPCQTFSNHDVPRTVSRYGAGGRDDALAKQLLLLLLCLKGTVLLYQGEELGLADAPVGREHIRDPFGALYYPVFKGRDPCRTPMPWHSRRAHAGFTSGTPWLPVGPLHGAQAVNEQEGDKDSVLLFAREAVRFRRESLALRLGGIDVIEAGDQMLAIERAHGDETLLCVFNLSGEPASLELGERAGWMEVGPGSGRAEQAVGMLHLGPRAAFLARKP